MLKLQNASQTNMLPTKQRILTKAFKPMSKNWRCDCDDLRMALNVQTSVQ